MSRYLPSRVYLFSGLAAVALAIGFGAAAVEFLPAAAPALLLALSAAALIYLYRCPAIEIHPAQLVVGKMRIAWTQIRRVDHTGWFAPLMVHLTLQDGSRATVGYPGDLDSANMLLREIRWHSHQALIDGVSYREYWRMQEGWREPESAKMITAPKVKPQYKLVSTAEEEEIERMYQRLKTVGRLDPRDEQ
jgi:hypothetical protein